MEEETNVRIEDPNRFQNITFDNVCFLVVRCWSCTIEQLFKMDHYHFSNDSPQRLQWISAISARNSPMNSCIL